MRASRAQQPGQTVHSMPVCYEVSTRAAAPPCWKMR
jgi:hypothetical protein